MDIIDADTAEFEVRCPFCERILDQIVRLRDARTGGFFSFDGSKGYAFACPACHKVLGFSDYSSS